MDILATEEFNNDSSYTVAVGLSLWMTCIWTLGSGFEFIQNFDTNLMNMLVCHGEPFREYVIRWF